MASVEARVELSELDIELGSEDTALYFQPTGMVDHQELLCREMRRHAWDAMV